MFKKILITIVIVLCCSSSIFAANNVNVEIYNLSKGYQDTLSKIFQSRFEKAKGKSNNASVLSSFKEIISKNTIYNVAFKYVNEKIYIYIADAIDDPKIMQQIATKKTVTSDGNLYNFDSYVYNFDVSYYFAQQYVFFINENGDFYNGIYDNFELNAVDIVCDKEQFYFWIYENYKVEKWRVFAKGSDVSAKIDELNNKLLDNKVDSNSISNSINKNDFTKNDQNIQKKDIEFTNFFNSLKGILFNNNIEYPVLNIFGKDVELKVSVKKILNSYMPMISSLVQMTWWVTLCSWIIYDIKNIINKMKNGSILENTNDGNIGGGEL